MQLFSNLFGPKPGATDQGGTTPSNGNFSGSATRPDGQVSVGFSLMRGKRATMEDFYTAQFQKSPNGGHGFVGLFGVFDGHGGPNAADFVRQHLFAKLLANPRFSSDIKTALIESFVETDRSYLSNDSGSARDDGCTAVTAVLQGQRLIIANVGDSRAVLSRAGQAKPLSEDHKPNRQDERARIEEAGGVVVWAGTWRVGGVLAVSRAFGDRLLKKYVVATPDLHEEQLTGEDEAVIMATDGLWDVISNQEAVDFIRDIKDAEKAAKVLTDEAFSRGSNDNISCVVLRFAFKR